ncbi:aminoglycoside phosphotransferase family protein [Solwaraspora sp. WMMD791]|uniref:aminoglycoside phosphotransferase family protein n=1 Tax=Solwaraspora sp. WMMD791 TaxID=3016086 RepID=UPI002499C8E5|nr:aminoglycoside phosphotransferase family protein [Solwaraspora sp. WMMD791]WFE29534.1 aminoglycoside phosphotransferase family protein [Solwaraspora sp. WMMD791]
MATVPDHAVLDWVAGMIGGDATVRVVRGLRAGDNPWLLRITQRGRTTEAVLKTVDPARPARLFTEIAALRLAEEQGVAAPRIIGYDTGDTGSGSVALLQTVVPGRSAIPIEPTAARLRAMGAVAGALRTIAVEPSPQLPVRTRPIAARDFARERAVGTDRTTPLLRYADERIRRHPVPVGDLVLVHGDLWQGNLMWTGDAVTGLIDWDMAEVGDNGIDLSALRLDAALMFGGNAADQVLASWADVTGVRPQSLAYWDAVAAQNLPSDLALSLATIHVQGRHDLSAATLNARRDAFLTAALNRLG